MKYCGKPRPISRNVHPILDVMHKILLMCENDQIDYSKGCSWQYVKNKVTHSRISDDLHKWSVIENINGEYRLVMYKIGSLASHFLKCCRNAFAHNCVYFDDKTETIRFDLQDKNGKDIFVGEIMLKSFNGIIELIIKSHDIKTNNTNENEKIK